MLGCTRVCFLCAFTLLVARVRGAQTFQWTFGNNYIEQSFTECQTLQVVVESLTNDTSAVGVPPYYMFAFEVGGIPSVTMVGSNPNNLSWTATHKRGASLMLTMMDSNTSASTGGVSPTLYTMEAGSNTSCLPSAPSAQLASVHPNVTGTMNTCDPWGLTIENGQKPYTVVLAALDSPVITNVTMGTNDDVYTWIDRANPNSQIMASVVDATGQWGISSNITHTAGSTDYSCVGLVSSSQTTAEIQQEEAAAAQAAANASNRRRTRLIVGLVVGLGVPIILGLALAAWLYKRRKPAIENGVWDNQDVTPRPLRYTDDSPTEMQHMGSSALSSPGLKSLLDPSTGAIHITPIPPVYFDREIAEARQRGTSVETSSGSGLPSMSRSSEGTSPAEAMRYRKALEASRGHVSSRPSSSSLRPTSAGSNPLVPAPLDPDIQPDIIIQHRDGGIVQELPPPYADRSAQAAAAPGETEIPRIPPPPSASTTDVSS